MVDVVLVVVVAIVDVVVMVGNGVVVVGVDVVVVVVVIADVVVAVAAIVKSNTTNMTTVSVLQTFKTFTNRAEIIPSRWWIRVRAAIASIIGTPSIVVSIIT